MVRTSKNGAQVDFALEREDLRDAMLDIIRGIQL